MFPAQRYNAATMSLSPSSPLEETLLIAGVGLIGGSLAAAVRARHIARRVIGLGRNAQRLQQAVDAGLLDGFVTTPADAPREISLVVVCTPVPRIVDDVRSLMPHLSTSALITDAGSTKQSICESLSDLSLQAPVFLGSHPIAGSDKQGFEYANADLFQGRTCVITPLPQHAEAAVSRVERFWQGVGMLTRRLSPAEHDRALARTSHVPHVVAAAVAGALSPSDLPWTGSGFRDTTRIAAGDPDLWTGILRENADEVLAGIAAVQRQLDQFAAALANGDAAALRDQLVLGKTLRDQLAEAGTTGE
ncbi:MAG: prephenate dehydrogenase/arogenate dehydrogenase family protein [Planctomycetaceae bacterium]|nr:prephenate dehydrogenase/arogenate dehydrogenase family protein [Planctomycetaceae bacterium]